MSIELEWTEPPTSMRGRGVSNLHARIAEQLKSKPDEWARIATGTKDSSLGGRIRAGCIDAYTPAGAFETATRTTGKSDGRTTYDVYVRFVGQGGGPVVSAFQPRLGDIGEPLRHIELEPLENPTRREAPVTAPEPEAVPA